MEEYKKKVRKDLTESFQGFSHSVLKRALKQTQLALEAISFSATNLLNIYLEEKQKVLKNLLKNKAF